MQDHTAESIKSLEGFRIAWVDEAQSLSARSLALLRPTIRTKNSELWASWKPHGLLEPATLEWLDATLTSAPERPALLFLHHPPFKSGIWHMDRQNLFNADELAEIVRRHPRVRLVATGHIHRATFTMFAGVPAAICPAPNHAVDLDLAQLREPSFKVEPPAFHLHVWFPGEGFGNLVTHHVPIGQFDGPHPFFGPDGKLL
jgi:3',5'-cyclic AMP phosphodiesterase CpdA